MNFYEVLSFFIEEENRETKIWELILATYFGIKNEKHWPESQTLNNIGQYHKFWTKLKKMSKLYGNFPFFFLFFFFLWIIFGLGLYHFQIGNIDIPNNRIIAQIRQFLKTDNRNKFVKVTNLGKGFDNVSKN